ncbi:hypothetical protein AJ79_06095 [Helicocarpus griseus UAMH5409]|uniref:Ubiquitin-protein ligase n=1 Tax=Helicocarpus griseus UAMH5409 TaxID=1447875 RepID=A0A2B7XGP2_9EURO|nr:hypothetical protein AJ79_06095 [Helicocarpus griseus UAMH5409]
MEDSVDIDSMADAAATVTTAAAAVMPSTSFSPTSALSPSPGFLNATLSKLPFLSPTSQNPVLYPLRVVYQAEVFMFVTVPRNALRYLGLERIITNMIDGATGVVGGAGAGGDVAGAAGAAAVGAADAAGASGYNFADLSHNMVKFGGIFSYMTSRWSIACFAVALTLNRVTIYGSTRRHLSLKWRSRLVLRIVPIVLFILQIVTLLQAIRCQTSPQYPELRYGKSRKPASLDYGGEGGFLYNLSSFFLPWQSDQGSCSAVHMSRPSGSKDVPYGSFSLLWPVFLRLCLNQFIETLSCALQGRGVVTEAGMSIFEHSLAFAEAETMISQSVGLGLFGLPKPTTQTSSATGSAGSSSTTQLLSRNQVLERLNVTPELLLIALISCCNSLFSNILDVFGRQSQGRLINTTFWGLCFMASMLFGFLNGSPLGNDTGVLKFPTVCIVGFVPHLLIFIGILACIAIYGLALLITAFSLPPNIPPPSSLRERFTLAHANMQGASQFQNVRFNPREDFYTALVRIGYASLAAASDAVFLNEGKSIQARNMTWLEEDRLNELEALRNNNASAAQYPGPRPVGLSSGINEAFSFDIPERATEWESGYGREKKFEKQKKGSRSIEKQTAFGGVGAFQGASRCYHGFTFFRGIFFLLAGWIAFWFIRSLDFLGVTARPRWLTKLGGIGRTGAAGKRRDQPSSLDFWILTDQGELELPEDHEFDVEKEMRKRELANATEWSETEKSRFDKKLYNWWKVGGSWGNQDESGDYTPSEDDLEDTTSVISMSTNSESEWEAYESDGRRTPTPRDPYTMGDPRDPWSNPSSRSNTPPDEAMLDMGSLARLLDPKDNEARHEARVLASHLKTADEGRIMTRSRFRNQMERDRARILTSSRSHMGSNASAFAGPSERKRPTPEEESEILENLILSRRLGQDSASGRQPRSWQTGASGLGADGPQCAVCQTTPRSIIAWPCRCLSVCEDCRVSLAMNNYGSCVTCRREVAGFVRLWVP